MILLPDMIWTYLLREFRKCRRRIEQVAYLDGIEIGDVAIVTTLTFPNAILRPGSFSVPAKSMSEAGRHLGSIARLAQVHTHPGKWVGHSDVDDTLAYSQHDGAISIVLPNYCDNIKSVRDIGIHICRRGIWRELTKTEADAVLQFVPSVFDFRKNQ